MTAERTPLPQLGSRLFLTDGGIETVLIFEDKIDLPHFAAFPLLRDPAGRAALIRYYERYIAIAAGSGFGFILESPTWRASADWAGRLGFTRGELAAANHQSIKLMLALKARYQAERMPVVVSGCVGPRGDGYDPGEAMSAAAAQDYHREQIAVFAASGAEMTTAITMTNTNEAIGVARAARASDLPVAISFTVETDGRLPTGQALGDAIAEVDAATANGPAYYMISCAHPTHFAGTLAAGGAWTRRVRGLRANASRRSHQELNESPDLDSGDPVALGEEYRDLRRRHPQITVLGGCCGTDHRHIERISLACREHAVVRAA